jgi:hypothetical protein
MGGGGGSLYWRSATPPWNRTTPSKKKEEKNKKPYTAHRVTGAWGSGPATPTLPAGAAVSTSSVKVSTKGASGSTSPASSNSSGIQYEKPWPCMRGYVGVCRGGGGEGHAGGEDGGEDMHLTRPSGTSAVASQRGGTLLSIWAPLAPRLPGLCACIP